MKFKLDDIKPNKYRNLDCYPINPEKIEQLKESIRTTGWWENIVARLNEDGSCELSHGHHRVHAMREMFPGDHEVELIIKDLSDETMLQMMARENLEEWGSSPAILQETVKSVVQAYADGEIELGPLSKDAPKSQLRFAPRFAMGDVRAPVRERPYTAGQVAKFAGCTVDKAQRALGALELFEQGASQASDFVGLGDRAARRVTLEVNNAKAVDLAVVKLHRRDAAAAAEAAEKAQYQRDKAEALALERQAAALEAKEANAKRKLQQEAAAAQQKADKAEKERRQKATFQASRERQAAQLEKDAIEKARNVSKIVSDKLKDGHGYKEKNLAPSVPKKKRDTGPPPHINKYVDKLAIKVENLAPMESDLWTMLAEVSKYKHHVSDYNRDNLLIAIRALTERLVKAEEGLLPDNSNNNVVRLDRIGEVSK